MGFAGIKEMVGLLFLGISLLDLGQNKSVLLFL